MEVVKITWRILGFYPDDNVFYNTMIITKKLTLGQYYQLNYKHCFTIFHNCLCVCVCV